jgi:2-haloacid dehalogenase
MSQLVNSPVTAILFDIRGIFLDWDPRHLYRSMFDDEEQMEWFLETICTADWHDAHDRGQPMAASSAELAGLHPEWEREITAWSKRSEEMVGGIMDDAISVLAELKTEGIRCFALTNMEAETYAGRVSRYKFFSLFDGIVVSGLEGTAKPDRAIFEVVVRRFHLVPSQTLFIDDRSENVAAARRLGSRSICTQVSRVCGEFWQTTVFCPHRSSGQSSAVPAP